MHGRRTNENAPECKFGGVEITVVDHREAQARRPRASSPKLPVPSTMLSERASKALGSKPARRTENGYSGLRRPNYAPVVSGIPPKGGGGRTSAGDPSTGCQMGSTGKGASYEP